MPRVRKQFVAVVGEPISDRAAHTTSENPPPPIQMASSAAAPPPALPSSSVRGGGSGGDGPAPSTAAPMSKLEALQRARDRARELRQQRKVASTPVAPAVTIAAPPSSDGVATMPPPPIPSNDKQPRKRRAPSAANTVVASSTATAATEQTPQTPAQSVVDVPTPAITQRKRARKQSAPARKAPDTYPESPQSSPARGGVPKPQVTQADKDSVRRQLKFDTPPPPPVPVKPPSPPKPWGGAFRRTADGIFFFNRDE